MKRVQVSALCVALTSLAGAAWAEAAPDGAKVTVSYGPKAEKALSETYGNKERATIDEMVIDSIADALGNKAARVEVVVNNITANRPTFKQLNDRSGLSFQSFGIGGADVSGKAYDASGKLIGEVTYDWYGDIDFASTAWVWSDADRAIRQFSRQLSRAVQD
jgi:hypothetical protein